MSIFMDGRVATVVDGDKAAIMDETSKHCHCQRSLLVLMKLWQVYRLSFNCIYRSGSIRSLVPSHHSRNPKQPPPHPPVRPRPSQSVCMTERDQPHVDRRQQDENLSYKEMEESSLKPIAVSGIANQGYCSLLGRKLFISPQSCQSHQPSTNALKNVPSKGLVQRR